MRTRITQAACIFTLALAATACAPAAETAPPPATPAAAAEPAPAPAPAPVAAPAPVLTPEQQKAQEEQKKLDADFAKLDAENKAELARLTPEVRAAGKALAEKSYPSTKAAVNAALASTHRQPGSAERDAARHPLATLEFFGVRPNQTVLEYGPGEGWFTEILAPTLAAKGKLIVTMPDPAGPRDKRETLYGERTKLFLAALPEVYGKVETVTIDPKAPKLPFETRQNAAGEPVNRRTTTRRSLPPALCARSRERSRRPLAAPLRARERVAACCRGSPASRRNLARAGNHAARSSPPLRRSL